MEFKWKPAIQFMLTQWQYVDIQVVPGVMHQIRCGVDESDPEFELQFNWFIDATEAPIHNHRHEFYSLCLEGEYTESLWQIKDTDLQYAVVNRFDRNDQKQTKLVEQIPGKLEVYKIRKHFPGNILHVTPDQFHSIKTCGIGNKRVLTFLRKRKIASHKSTTFLTDQESIDDDKVSMRPAIPEERNAFREKLLSLIQ